MMNKVERTARSVSRPLTLAVLACSLIGAATGAWTAAAAPIVAQVGEGGEEASFVFVDPAGRFSFEYPQSWSASTQPGEDIRFNGPDEFISVALVDTAVDPMEFAATDESALATASADYQGKPLRAYQANGTSAAAREYSWQAGPSPVTGKLVSSIASRYYLPGPLGKLAVFTYSSPARLYDPEGADDFAAAFKWLP